MRICSSQRGGYAAVLILVSFLYQRFMTGRDEEGKQEA
jgi:hypothetical protein